MRVNVDDKPVEECCGAVRIVGLRRAAHERHAVRRENLKHRIDEVLSDHEYDGTQPRPMKDVAPLGRFGAL